MVLFLFFVFTPGNVSLFRKRIYFHVIQEVGKRQFGHIICFSHTTKTQSYTLKVTSATKSLADLSGLHNSVLDATFPAIFPRAFDHYIGEITIKTSVVGVTFTSNLKLLLITIIRISRGHAKQRRNDVRQFPFTWLAFIFHNDKVSIRNTTNSSITINQRLPYRNKASKWLKTSLFYVKLLDWFWVL